ncbi:hypothetical protein ACI2JA_03815 [Alkalihalobacillus sp. NPDC078783]
MSRWKWIGREINSGGRYKRLDLPNGSSLFRSEGLPYLHFFENEIGLKIRISSGSVMARTNELIEKCSLEEVEQFLFEEAIREIGVQGFVEQINRKSDEKEWKLTLDKKETVQ